MLVKDIEFLRWIANRLVHKYKEDPKIILLINEIICRFDAEINANQKTRNTMIKNINEAIKLLNTTISCNNSVHNIIQNLSTEKLIDQNVRTFENIDIALIK